MTFKDSSVIISNDDEDAGDILENVDLQSNFKQRMKLKKQAEASGIGMRQDGSKMLPQYDEEDEEETGKKQNRIVLAVTEEEDYNGGMSHRTKEERMEELRDKLSQKHKQKFSLDVKKVSLFHVPNGPQSLRFFFKC